VDANLTSRRANTGSFRDVSTCSDPLADNMRGGRTARRRFGEPLRLCKPVQVRVLSSPPQWQSESVAY
jgi:hypothetical protein